MIERHRHAISQWFSSQWELVILGSCYFLVRLLFINSLPIFNDEAIIIDISRIMFVKPSQWILLTSDSRQPLFGMTMALGQLLPVPPLVGARLTMIAWSLVTFVACMMVARALGVSKRVRRWWAIFLILCPYLVLNDTLALPESPITALGVLMIFVTLTFLGNPSLKWGIVLGILISIGWWYFSLIFIEIPAILLIAAWHVQRHRKDWRRVLIFFMIAAIVALALSLPILIQEHYWQVAAEAPKRFLSVREVLAFPITRWMAMLMALIQWLVGFATAPAAILATIGAVGYVSRSTVRLALIAVLLPLFLTVFFVQTASARNMVIIVPMYLLLAACVDTNAVWLILLRWLTASSMAILTVLLLVSPITYYKTLGFVPEAKRDFSQYIGGWSSGYGVQEAASYLAAIAGENRIIVLTRFDSGNPEDGIRVLLRIPNIRYAYPYQMEKIISSMQESGSLEDIYFVSRGEQLMTFASNLTLLAKFPKPIGDEYVGVYKFHFN